MRRLGEQAVVVGASMAGLLAARVLADAYEQVRILERDALPAGSEQRRAVPQGWHVHALLPRGGEAIEELLPGITDELIDDGAQTAAALCDTHFRFRGYELPRVALGSVGITASRPFIEGHVRRRVLGLSNVELHERCEALAPRSDGEAGRITGVRARGVDGGGEETMHSDLLILAGGRSARLPAWLDDLGYGRPAESVVKVNLGYASRAYRLPENALVDRQVLIGGQPDRPYGMALFIQEGDRWLLTVAGLGDHRPSGDEDAFQALLEKAAPPEVLAAVREGEPLGEIATFGFPASRWRHYERMRRFPDGLLPIGDAICSFNPLYGQGMTVAAMQALALRRCLERGERRLAKRFLRAAARVADPAWRLSAGGDLAVPEVEGERSLSVRLANAYAVRVQKVAAHDAEVSAALMRVTGLLDPPACLIRPAVARRVFAGGKLDSLLWPGRPLARPVRRRTLRVQGVSTVLREAGPSEASEAVVFVHGNPGSGADFEPLLAAAGRLGRAVAWDAPGFGRAQASESFKHSVGAHARFIGAALDELGIERACLVLHDFGGPWGLAWAAGEPERLVAAVLIGTGALIDYRWHALARIWRTRHAGELLMAATSRTGFGLILRRGQNRRLPGPFIDRMYTDFDQGTRQAVLRLYRSVDDVAAEGRRLADTLRPLKRPALVIWGQDDPYLPAALAERQREAFPDAEVYVLPESGHWPFVDQADCVQDLILDFLARTAQTQAATAADQLQPAVSASAEQP